MKINTKKNLRFAIVFIITLLMNISVFATKRYWVGTGANINWNATANWSTTSGGASGSSVPGSSDSVYYDGNGIGQCSINAAVNIKRLELGSGYIDTVKQNTYAITVGTSGMVLSGGTFWGGSSGIIDGGLFTLAGTKFQSSSAGLQITGNYTFSSGTFSHNNGTVTFIATSTITGSTAFYNMNFSPTTTSTYTIASGTTLTCDNTLKTASAFYMILNTGTIDVKGDIIILNTNVQGGGSATINISGTGTQTYTGTTPGVSGAAGAVCNIKINKPSGILYLKNVVNLVGTWEHVAGAVDDTTYSAQLSFPIGGYTSTIKGTQTIRALWLGTYGGGRNTFVVNSGDTLTVSYAMNTGGNGAVTFAGYTNIKGNFSSGSASTSGGGTGTITINGSGNQTITGTAIGKGGLCNVIIDKPSGTLTLKSTITVRGDWIYIQGAIDATTYNSTVAFAYTSGGKEISGSHSLNNISMYADRANNLVTYTISSNDTLTVLGELIIEQAGRCQINTGTIVVKGDITITNTGNYTLAGGTGNIIIDGTNAQTINGTSVNGNGNLCNLIINKSSGTLTLKNRITVAGYWTYVQGAIDATTYSSTVIFPYGGRVISSGSQPFYKVNLSAISGPSTNVIPLTDTLIVMGELTIEGNSTVAINTGTINAKGDVTMTNSNATSNGGSGWINICGTGSQTLTGSGIATTGKLCNIKVNKPSGTLYLSSIISLYRYWIYVKGNVDPGSSTLVCHSTTNDSLTCQGISSMMNFNNFTIYDSKGITLSGNLSVLGTLSINTSATFNSNSKDVYIGGNWNQGSGTYTSGTSMVTYNGTSRQFIIKNTGANINFYKLKVDKSSGVLQLSTPITAQNTFTLTKGVIRTTNTNILQLNDNISFTGGSDSAYVSGPIKKTGNDAFIFPLGDTTLNTGAYHPLSITAPSSTTDAFTAQYYASNQSSGSALQTDSLESISTNEYWNLTRNTGTSTVIPSLGWNSNSSNVTNCNANRVAAWDGSQWKSLGFAGKTVSGNQGTLKAAFGYSASSLPLVIARPINSSQAPTVTINPSLDTICSGSSVSITASGSVTYLWIPATGLSSTTGATVIASPTSTTTYTVIGTNANGCTGTAAVTISVPCAAISINTTGLDTLFLPDTLLYTISGLSGTYAVGGTVNFSPTLPSAGNVSTITISFAETTSYEATEVLVDLNSGGGLQAYRVRPVGGSEQSACFASACGINLANGNIPITGCVISSCFQAKPPYYAVLKKKLDAGYYSVTQGHVYFKYFGEYNNGNLDFKIYDDMHVLKSCPSISSKQYGDNRFAIDLAACTSISANSGYYVLEVVNEKNEKFVLKFKY